MEIKKIDFFMFRIYSYSIRMIIATIDCVS